MQRPGFGGDDASAAQHDVLEFEGHALFLDAGAERAQRRKRRLARIQHIAHLG